jgi:glutamine amidotransferase
VGWTALREAHPWGGSALAPIAAGSFAYFSHSYFPRPADDAVVLATATHAGIEFCSFFRQDNIQASQFHPDMSGSVGLAIVKAFADQ